MVSQDYITDWWSSQEIPTNKDWMYFMAIVPSYNMALCHAFKFELEHWYGLYHSQHVNYQCLPAHLTAQLSAYLSISGCLAVQPCIHCLFISVISWMYCTHIHTYLLPSGWNATLLIGPKCPFTLPISSSNTRWKNRASNFPTRVVVVVTSIASCPPPRMTWNTPKVCSYYIKAMASAVSLTWSLIGDTVAEFTGRSVLYVFNSCSVSASYNYKQRQRQSTTTTMCTCSIRLPLLLCLWMQKWASSDLYWAASHWWF